MEILVALTLFVSLAMTSGEVFQSGVVSQTCMQCMCDQESRGCNPLDCQMDGGSLSCGYFQIKRHYYTDCGSPGSGWESCAKDLACASGCVQTYMGKYVNKKGCSSNCESVARLHNGGPRGCQKPSTDRYWAAIVGQGCSANS
ncbi:hypothetical protein ScPMuIL_001859 [Solemya velum]